MPASCGLRRPESVLVIVHTPAAEVLLLKRATPFDFWQSVTGSLEPGETHSDAARREVFEETGIAADTSPLYTGVNRLFTIDPRWRNRYPNGVTENVEYEYRLAVAGIVEVNTAIDEHSCFDWVPIDEAIDRVWSWTNRQALKNLRMKL